MTYFQEKRLCLSLFWSSSWEKLTKINSLMKKKIPINLKTQNKNTQNSHNCISGVMVSVLASSALGHGFEPWLGHTTDYENGICCFSAKHTALRRKSKDWWARNQDNMSECGDMSIHGLLFQWASIMKIHLSVLV